VDKQALLNWVYAAACGVGGWWFRVLWDAQQQLRRDLAKLQQSLPDTYVRRDDWKDQLKEIKEMLTRIVDKLDEKADKPGS
jgi:hypothetical protein